MCKFNYRIDSESVGEERFWGDLNFHIVKSQYANKDIMTAKAIVNCNAPLGKMDVKFEQPHHGSVRLLPGSYSVKIKIRYTDGTEDKYRLPERVDVIGGREVTITLQIDENSYDGRYTNCMESDNVREYMIGHYAYQLVGYTKSAVYLVFSHSNETLMMAIIKKSITNFGKVIRNVNKVWEKHCVPTEITERCKLECIPLSYKTAREMLLTDDNLAYRSSTGAYYDWMVTDGLVGVNGELLKPGGHKTVGFRPAIMMSWKDFEYALSCQLITPTEGDGSDGKGDPHRVKTTRDTYRNAMWDEPAHHVVISDNPIALGIVPVSVRFVNADGETHTVSFDSRTRDLLDHPFDERTMKISYVAPDGKSYTSDAYNVYVKHTVAGSCVEYEADILSEEEVDDLPPSDIMPSRIERDWRW